MAEIKNGNQIKVVAYYLPQFHAIPENDRAWGKGFTEWTNTRKAKPQFEGHYQPKVPLGENYYDLTDVNVMVEQSKLAQEYGVFGFCYYHYWFKNGKKLLERPVEQMLAEPKVTIPFCLSWANENWSKLWDGGNKELIVEQDYGGRDEWKKHLEYLVTFFRDPRYITLDGKPVFIIYKPDIMPNVQKMLAYWQSLAPAYGFKAFCFMIQGSSGYFMPDYYLGEFDYQIKFPPFFCTVYESKDMNKVKKMQRAFKILRVMKADKIASKLISGVKQSRTAQRSTVNTTQTRLEYDNTWRILLESESAPELIEGALVDWDNTARKLNGYVHIGATPEKFGKYMKCLYKKIRKNHQEPVVFLNAWNEWCEGAYLEPDEKHGYDYLKELKKASDPE